MEAYLPISIFSKNLLIGKRPFQGGAMSEKMSFLEHIANKFQRFTIFQLNIKGLCASYITVIQYLALQFEAFVILLQETHCTNAKKLQIISFQLVWSSLSRKHDFDTLLTSDYVKRFWTELHIED